MTMAVLLLAASTDADGVAIPIHKRYHTYHKQCQEDRHNDSNGDVGGLGTLPLGKDVHRSLSVIMVKYFGQCITA